MNFKSLLVLLTGLMLLTALGFICVNHHGPIIQKDLEQRVTRVLDKEGMNWSRPVADGQVVTLTGSAPTQALRQNAAEVTQSVWGVDSVTNLLIASKLPESLPRMSPDSEISRPIAPTPKPYTFKLDFNGKTAILSGHVPNEKILTEIDQASRQQLGKTNVINRLAIAPGEPGGFVHTIIHGLIPNFEGFTQVIAKLEDNRLVIEGSAPSEEAHNALQQSLSNAVPGRIATTFNIQVPQAKPPPDVVVEKKVIPADVCQQQLDDLLLEQQVTFASGQAVIEKTSYPLLDLIALIANKCPETKIEIGGHTDASGNNRSNQRLSKRRADAVLSHLVSKDVDMERLTTKGYGETRPIASNTTIEGQIKNRRIEFTTLE
jgi:OOP family OmpA-OmpF porin